MMGSCMELWDLGTINAPAYLCHQTQQDDVRNEFLSQMNQLLPQRIIQLEKTGYVLANVVQKSGRDQVIIHMVNYLNSVKNVQVRLNLEGIVRSIDKEKIRIYSPDGVSEQLSKVIVSDEHVEFVIPELKIYNMIVIN